MFGSWRSSSYGCDYGDMNEDGLSQAITPFVGGAMQGGLGSGNARRVGHRDDLSKVMSPNGICRVCEYVVSGFHHVHCTVCNHVVHPDCSTQFGMNAVVCHRCIGERNRQTETCQRAQTTHRVATDLGRSAIRNTENRGKCQRSFSSLHGQSHCGVGTLDRPRSVERDAR